MPSPLIIIFKLFIRLCSSMFLDLLLTCFWHLVANTEANINILYALKRNEHHSSPIITTLLTPLFTVSLGSVLFSLHALLSFKFLFGLHKKNRPKSVDAPPCIIGRSRVRIHLYQHDTSYLDERLCNTKCT